MATGVIQALAAQNLDGKIPVTGLDAELTALQRVAEGTQICTLRFPLETLADGAIVAAIEMAKGETPSAISMTTNNGIADIPTISAKTITITKDNLVEEIIELGIYTIEEVYKNVPKDQWPNQ